MACWGVLNRAATWITTTASAAEVGVKSLEHAEFNLSSQAYPERHFAQLHLPLLHERTDVDQPGLRSIRGRGLSHLVVAASVIDPILTDRYRVPSQTVRRFDQPSGARQIPPSAWKQVSVPEFSLLEFR